MKPLAAAETAVRRWLLMVGFGFIAFVGGKIVAFSVMARLGPRVEGGPDVVLLVLGFLADSAWALAALPALAWFASRFLELRPWATGIIGTATGMLFQLALQYVSGGEEGLVSDPVRQLLRLATAAGGVALTALAVKRGREAARLAEERAREQAAAKKAQYDDFIRQAEALANRREEVPIAAAPGAKEEGGPPDPKG